MRQKDGGANRFYRMGVDRPNTEADSRQTDWVLARGGAS